MSGGICVLDANPDKDEALDFQKSSKNIWLAYYMQYLENRPDMIYYIENDAVESDKIISDYIDMLKNFIQSNNLNENEIKLGQALYDLFENYENIFIGNSNNKFNKNIILLSLREMTNLSTKEIRSSMKKFKGVYSNLLEEILKH